MSELSAKEEYKLEVITKVINGEIKQVVASKLLELSTRQVRRLQHLILEKGDIAIIHKLKGKASNHKLEDTFKEKVLNTVKYKYLDFKPTFASEKLSINEGLIVNPQTLRRWMIKENLWKLRKQKKVDYHAWRPRRGYFGELEQFDGSYHYWLEDRFVDTNTDPIEVCLLASIDDATGKITKAVFAEHEGVIPVFKFWREYIEEFGKPIAIYLDKFSTYKINHKNAVDNTELMTQFQRAMRELGIEVINANSPQAKGRVERLFQTLQDRLIKELRLAGINNPASGNIFLKNIFIPEFNSRFSTIPSREGNLHKFLTKEEKENLSHIFSIKSQRRINMDFTIQFKNKWYQLKELQPTTVRARNIVLIEEHLDNSLSINFKDKYLNFFALPTKPKKIKNQPLVLTSHKLNYKPPLNHPWKQPRKY